jgi:HK97 gp10 family phage protein
MTQMKWYGKEFLQKLKEEQAKNLERAAIHVKNKVKENISDAYPPASSPEDFPHRRDGELRRSMAHEVDKDKLVARVGTNKVYGRHLELGTSKMKKRPFLRTTLAEERRAIAKLMTAKIKL